MPVRGIERVTPPTLISTCSAIHIRMPATRNEPNGSAARCMMRSPRHSSSTNSSSTTVTPTKPSSSPMMERMPSVWAAGTKKNFCRDTPRPRPVHPPEPRAMSIWSVWKPKPSGSVSAEVNERMRVIP